jgi:AMP phosphorylase
VLLKVRLLGLEAGGKFIVVLGREDASDLGVISNDRVRLITNNSEIVAILNTSSDLNNGLIGVFNEVAERLDLEEGEIIEVKAAERPESLNFIRGKIMGRKLTQNQIESIVADVVERHVSDIELSAFVTSLQIHGTSMEEVESLSRAMIKMGKRVNFENSPILDKHSIGGVPGDKTTLIVVPIIAAAGYTIPKSSSRAITSPAGTADRMEALCEVDFHIEEIKEIVEETGGCIVWGGALDLAPADDLFIQVEYPLRIDPLLLPSIMSKKKAMGSTHTIIDIPTGPDAKIKTVEEAQQLAFDFIELGGRLDMNIRCAITEGTQPIGHSMGPTLEAMEAMQALMGGGPHDLTDKATSLAGILLEMVGEENGKEMARELIRSGRAEKKMREIIAAQGGDPEIQPSDMTLGYKWVDIEAEHNGRILWMDNRELVQIARVAGTPNDKGSGIHLMSKLGDRVQENDTLFRIYSQNNRKLNNAEKLARELRTIGVGKRIGEKMLMMKISESKEPGPKSYIIDR